MIHVLLHLFGKLTRTICRLAPVLVMIPSTLPWYVLMLVFLILNMALTSSQPFFETPDFVASVAPTVSDDTPIDLVFVDFIEDQLLGILNTVQTTKKYTEADVQSYTPVLATEVLGLYAQQAWN